MATAKIARIRLSTHIVQDILTGKAEHWAGKSNAPEDLEVLGVEQPPYAIGQWFYVICRSDAFRPIPEAGEVPEIPPFELSHRDNQGGPHG